MKKAKFNIFANGVLLEKGKVYADECFKDLPASDYEEVDGVETKEVVAEKKTTAKKSKAVETATVLE